MGTYSPPLRHLNGEIQNDFLKELPEVNSIADQLFLLEKEINLIEEIETVFIKQKKQNNFLCWQRKTSKGKDCHCLYSRETIRNPMAIKTSILE